MSALDGKADIARTLGMHKKPGNEVGFFIFGSGGSIRPLARTRELLAALEIPLIAIWNETRYSANVRIR